MEDPELLCKIENISLEHNSKITVSCKHDDDNLNINVQDEKEVSQAHNHNVTFIEDEKFKEITDKTDNETQVVVAVNQTEEKVLTNLAAIKQTALIYDERMSKYWCMESPSHVERPARIRSIYEKLLEVGLVDRCNLIEPRCATQDEILLKHNEKHYEMVQSVKDKTREELQELAMVYDSIYFHPAVTECACLAAGCTLQIVEHVIQGKVLNGAAVIRPPGHHALSHSSMGFCHFNNVALAAMLALAKYELKRILIVDWDIHYGNGTHKMFASDPRVLYFSIHRYDNNRFWPCLTEGNYNAVGCGVGEGFNIHVAWNRGKMGDADYMLAFDNVLLPVAEEFNPELILVSAGFDSGKGDPLGGCDVTPSGYALMTDRLMQFAGGKVVIVLEGGYNLKTISNSMAACVSTLLGDPVPECFFVKPCVSAIHSVHNTLSAVKKYWNSLQDVHEIFIETYSPNDEDMKSGSSSSDSESLDLMHS